MFDGAPCGLVVTREDGTILEANLTFSNWLGFNQQGLNGQRFQSLLTMGGRIFHQTHWAPLMQMQGSVAEVKLDLIHRDKHIVPMLLNGVRREQDTGAFYELALFCTTDRDKYERELLKARKRAEELLAEKMAAEAALLLTQEKLNEAHEKAQRRALFAEQMVAIVSHDLKNPLTAIKMASEILARTEQRTKETKLLGHISGSADRAHRMIAELLDFALARVGRGIMVSFSMCDLHKIASQSVAELQVAFPQAQIVHVTIGSGSVKLDSDRVQQIIGNLVANSVAYGDLQQPITITSGIENDTASICVHNAGSVIPESLRSVLFEPMTRGTGKESDVRSVGLGLFIVREIARAHGGDVSVNSTVKNGTSFTAHFPTV
ncbi:Adaptive-response sensory-kinase SasA [Pseudomonas fluorescens]|uniref:histidine kinase n=1 Tax=Pseudomonas fluorescens TaxID=294 RepID=A0A5E7VLX6_PSEFL|nr:Adaptive-response sensory-kinase SasA [Pseudomonas fluorescens]